MIDIGCYSHTIDLVGRSFALLTWIASSACECLCLHTVYKPGCSITGKAVTFYSPTCWRSKWEEMSQVMAFFSDVTHYLQANPEVSPATNQG